MKVRIKSDLMDLMMVPGLSGHEDPIRAEIRRKLATEGIQSSTDRLGNLISTFKGDTGPSVMVFAHMDQLGFVVRKIDDDGMIKVIRMGGVPERALLSQAVLLYSHNRPYLEGIISNKSHHITEPNEKYEVPKASQISIDTGFKNKLEVSIREIRKSDFTYHSLRTHNKNNIFDQRKLSSYSLLENKSFKQLMTIGNPINTSSVLCKREIFEVVKFCEGKKFITVEDFECWINISRNNFRFKRIDKVLGFYNISSQNTSVTYVKNPLKFIHIFNKHKKYLLNDNLKVLSKNHFRYLMAYSLKKRELKKKYFYYLLFSKILKSKLKIILRLFFTLF